MKKLIVIAIVSMMASFQAFAVPGIDCNTPDARCSAYELEVNAEVLKTIDFEVYEILNLGQVAKGEIVSVSAVDNAVESRGRQQGKIIVYTSVSSEDIHVKCIAGSSSVDFGNAEGATAFDSCSMTAVAGTLLSGSSSWETVTQTSLSPASEHVINPGAEAIGLWIGGEISVPSNATDGSKTGVMRVEVAYQ